MKYSGHRKLLCESSKLSKLNAFIILRYKTNTDASILVYKFRPERTGFNMYAGRIVYTTAINFPCISTLILYHGSSTKSNFSNAIKSDPPPPPIFEEGMRYLSNSQRYLLYDQLCWRYRLCLVMIVSSVVFVAEIQSPELLIFKEKKMDISFILGQTNLLRVSYSVS